MSELMEIVSSWDVTVPYEVFALTTLWMLWTVIFVRLINYVFHGFNYVSANVKKFTRVMFVITISVNALLIISMYIWNLYNYIVWWYC